jgi:hypothetical protein
LRTAQLFSLAKRARANNFRLIVTLRRREGERMINVLDVEPLRAVARRAAGKIADERIAARFERLAVARLMHDQRNFRAATAAELRHAPAWTQAALARGDAIGVFKLHRSAAQRLHNLARRLEDTRRLAALDVAHSPHSAAYIGAARDFIGKLERADFETTKRKAYQFARMLIVSDEAQDDERVCAHQTVATVAGRHWLRVTSVNELRAVGREFGNCLARASRAGLYGAGLNSGQRQFWVLRDVHGVGRIVVMADAPQATGFMEVRGPRNARICASDLDLMLLSRALGIRPPPPPPLPPSGVLVRMPSQSAPALPSLRLAARIS